MVAVMTRACSGDTAPAAWAAATAGYTGGSTCPVGVSRGPSRRAACTRPLASPGDSRSTPRSSACVLRAPTVAATPRVSNSATRT